MKELVSIVVEALGDPTVGIPDSYAEINPEDGCFLVDLDDIYGESPEARLWKQIKRLLS